MKREALRVTSTIPVAPTTLYFAWIDSAHHSAMTGGTAKIDPTVGAKYSAWNGYITGKLLILDLGRRIVMSWRTTEFPRDAADSRVEVHFETLGTSTRILILHTEIPEGQAEKYKAGWNEKYIAPMRTYFSKFLPDPRNPPVRRIPPPPIEDDEEEEDEVPVKGKGKLGKGVPAKASGPSLHKAAKAVVPAPAKGKPAPAAKAPPPKAPPPPKAAPSKAAPAKKAPPPPAKKPAAPAKKPAAPAKKAPPPAKKPAAKKPAPKKPAPKPAAKGKKKR